MNRRSGRLLTFAVVLAGGQPLAAQVLPDPAVNVQEAVQGLVERQVEQAQAAALERTLGQAEAAAAQQVLDRAEAQQAELIQNRAQEQLASQVERVQATAASRAEATIQQVVEQVDQVVEQVVEHVEAATRADPPGPAQYLEFVLEPRMRAVQFEWIMLVTPAERARLDAEATELLTYLSSTHSFAQSGDVQLLIFSVPPDLDTDAAILQLVPESLRNRIDRNHVYGAEAPVAAR